ncbi:hypothetical protein B0H67DRAFT_686590 [Lasiosphaeris hirsuta]|uniref:Uncharacterized protein n=1 Tax=Lasiosphaeris hirsuta TaxID=260670 RepID=A0AA40A3F2_9PEZI|nr:hypothetical protein B0H67DRAFT_686590 [Lasiosphaeris hirsuta]
MPPEYWTGRFTALHDRDHNQLLECQNLNLIVDAHVERSSLCNNTTTSSHQSSPVASTWNNPSTSVYANKRVGLKHLDNYQPGGSRHGHSRNNSATRPSRIPNSATSGAILETPRRYVNKDYSTRIQPPPRLPSYDQAISKPTTLHFHRRNTLPGNGSGVGENIYASESAELRAAAAAEAAKLTDDESRCLRVLAQLEAHCATTEAVISFRSWQQDFARSTKRDVLLPEGGTMGGLQHKVSANLVKKLEGLLSVGGRKNDVGNRPAHQQPDQDTDAPMTVQAQEAETLKAPKKGRRMSLFA